MESKWAQLIRQKDIPVCECGHTPEFHPREFWYGICIAPHCQCLFLRPPFADTLYFIKKLPEVKPKEVKPKKSWWIW